MNAESFRSALIQFFFILKIMLDIEATLDNHKISCQQEQHHVIIPFIATISGKFVSNISLGSEDYKTGPNADKRTAYPSDLYVTIPLGDVDFTLELHKHNIHTSERHRKWTSGNITYSQLLVDDCFYQGSVIGQDRSFVAVALCDGLNGYIQTDEYEMLIDPMRHQNREYSDNGQHRVKTCSIPKDIGRMRPRERDHRREKRQARSGRKYLEVLIAADTSVTAVIGKDSLDTYLLTLMNIVNKVYKHDTLSADIEVVTVKTLELDKSMEDNIISKNDARKTVDNFCQWTTKQAYNRMINKGGYHFDVAVLLTRTGIGPAGYAPITGMCNPGRSCAIVKDEGLTSAFIIAHEVAHVFGLYHNGHGNTCSGRQYETSIMAAMVKANLQQYWWTDCSSKRMDEVLPSLTCLNNKPSASHSVDLPLGEKFSLDKQCRYEFGAENTLCPHFFGQPCAMLWCSGPSDRGNRMCKTKRAPPLEGTPCGTEKQCENGQCVYFGHHTPVNGGWGAWGNWSSCSAACGIGLRQRTRDCTNPRPQYDGKDCTGESNEMDTCKSTTCTSFTDVRRVQCFMLDSMRIRPDRHNWLPYQVKDPKKLCVLSCVSNLTGEIETFDNIPVDNGVPCSYDEANNICVDGKCMHVGCDGKMNSSAKEDECGVCNGDGSQCKTVNGRFQKKFTTTHRDYMDLLVLPKGARNFKITEVSKASHFLALQDPRYGTFILNGGRTLGRSREFAAAGAWFVYENNGIESLESKGPIQTDLEVKVFPRDKHSFASYDYQYTISKDDNTHEKMLYYFKYEGWTDCSVTCGTGEQSLIYGCYSKENDSKVEQERCKYLEDPRGKPHKCRRSKCSAEQLRWAMLNDWTDCNETCGDHGMQYQLYKCERDTRGQIEYMDLSVCDEVLPPPTYTRACNRVPCKVYQWMDSGKWSECSETCGNNGKKERLFICKDHLRKDVDDSYCTGPKPEKTDKCNVKPCEIFKLVSTGSWGPCSETCGENAYQTMLTECVRVNSRNKTEKVSKSECVNILEEDEIRPCPYVPCYKATYKWIVYEDWSECSSECGNVGVQFKINKCFDVTYEYAMKNVEDQYCDKSMSANMTRTCNRIDCFDYNWVSQSWSDCSSTCGTDGIRKQLFSCAKVYLNKTVEDVDESLCSHLQYPVITEDCNRIPCEIRVYSWIMIPEWTECSVSCGEGIQSGLVGCFEVYKNDTMTRAENETLCQFVEKPNYQRSCTKGPCESYQWSKEFDWTACSESCGEQGIQNTIHVCERVLPDGSIIPTSSSLCKDIPDISRSRSCNRIPCISWRYRIIHLGYLSECSETCGENGVRFYHYVCEREFVNGSTEEVKMENCADIVFPNTTYPCNRVSCGREWVTDNWSRCSVSCGVGAQKRYIFCGSIAENLNPAECSASPPATTRVCSQQNCPPNACVDKISLCTRGATERTCRYRGYQFMCCATCSKFQT